MQKLSLRFFCFVLLLAGYSSKAQFVIIGAGASSGTASNGATGDSGPMYRSSGTSNFIYSRHHYLYTQAELVAAGLPTGATITQLSWNKDNAAASSAPYSFEIWMKNSALTAVQAPPQTWTTLITGSTQVYNNTAANLPAAIGYVDHLLSAPFTYTGGGLEISVNYDHSSASSPWSTLGVSWTRDPINNRTISYCGSTASTSLSNARTVRPQLKITYTTGPCTAPPTPGTTLTSQASVCAGTNITLSLTGNSTGTGQTYQLQSATTATGTYTNVGASSSSATNSIAATTTLWYRYAVTCGTQTANSAPVQVTVAPLFPAGTYTINSAVATGGTNYQTFNAAIAALSCGIAGPVVFNVVAGSGPYNERVVIPHIATTSATNTITINGNAATLTYASTATAERGTMTLDGADYIRVNNLKIFATGTTYGAGVHMLNDANNNIINGCQIYTDTTATGTGFAGISLSGSASSFTTAGSDCDSNVISNNTINGGYYGITLLGDGTTSQVNGNRIKGNTITNFYYYGIYLNGTFGLLVDSNDVSRPTRTNTSNFYALYVTTGNIGGNFTRNRIHNSCDGELTSTSTQYPIYISADGTVANPNIFSNNLVYNINGRGIAYAIYKTGADNVKILHNTLSLDYANATAATTAVAGFYQTAAHSGLDFSNNIVSVGRNSTAARYAVYIATATATFTGSNNDYYVTGTTGTTGIGYYGGAGYTTLATWQTATTQDAGSVTTNPVFTAPATGNFLPTATALDNLGTPKGVLSDIRGLLRSSTTPDMGAYEFGITPCNPVSVAASAITAATATLSWTRAPGATGYEYVLNNTATAPTGAGTATTDTFYNASGLTAATVYYMHVRTNCGGGSFSTWTTISFTTLCATNPTATVTPAGATTVCAPNTVVLNANTGTGLTYQWKNGTANIAGATNASYTATTSGSYSVIVSSGACNATSAAVTVTINPAPAVTVTMNPANGIICGGTVTLTASGGTGVTYQWFNGTNAIGGATSATYAASTGGNYTVQVTNATTTCSTVSNGSTVTIVPPPTSNVTPAGNINLCVGDSLVLSGPTGAGYTYQWKNGSANATGASTSVNYMAKQAGAYTLVVTANGCSTTSAVTNITAQPLPLSVMSPSTPATACDFVTLSTTNTNVTYQWMYNGTPILGATSPTYAAPVSGSYSLKTTSVQNGCVANSPAVAITVNQSPNAAITYSSPIQFCEGGAVVLNTYTGNNLAFEWRRDTSVIAGSNTNIYTALGSGNYSVKVINTVTGCTGTSQPVVVKVHPLPEPAIVYNASSNTLTTTQPFAQYQWMRNNQHINGATLRNHIPQESGAYHVIVTDTNGCTNLSEVKFVNNVGIGNTPEAKSVKIYPNPTSGLLYVKAATNVTLLIRDITGKTVLNGTGNEPLNMGPLTDGMYVLYVTDQSGHLLRVEKVSKSAQK